MLSDNKRRTLGTNFIWDTLNVYPENTTGVENNDIIEHIDKINSVFINHSICMFRYVKWSIEISNDGENSNEIATLEIMS